MSWDNLGFWPGSGGGGSSAVSPVSGRGIVAGSRDGLEARPLTAGGALRLSNPTGIGGGVRVASLPVKTLIARATIDLANGDAQLIKLIPGLEEVEVESVSFRKFSDAPDPGVGGGLYDTAPTASGVVASAAIVEFMAFDGWAGGLATLQAVVLPAIRPASALWWCPSVVSATPLTCEVEIWGLPRWIDGFDPNDALPPMDTLVATGDSFTAQTGYIEIFAKAQGAILTKAATSGTVMQNSADADGGARSNNFRDTFATRALGPNKRNWVSVAYGYNDARYTGAPSTFNVAAYANDYREAMNGLRERGALGYAADRILILSPWYVIDAGLVSGSTGFTGQTRPGFEAFVAAARAVAIEYGTYYADMYDWLRDNGGVPLYGNDNIHLNSWGERVCAHGAMRATRLNSLPGPIDFTASAPITGAITLSGIAPAGDIDDYTVQWGAAGSYIYNSGDVVASPSARVSGVAPGTYRVRIRANYADGTHSPWEFAATDVVVS